MSDLNPNPTQSRTSPATEELIPVLLSLKASNPALGLEKLTALLVRENPGWSVSEKRVKKVLVEGGVWTGGRGKSGVAANGGSEVVNEGGVYPKSKMNDYLKVESYTRKVAVKHFGKKKGKGLVATEVIEEGEEVWKEDPFVLAPEWELYDAQQSSISCTHCTTPLIPLTPLHKTCTHASTGPVPGLGCTAKFCSLVCRNKAQSVHPLFCPGQNKAAVPFLEWVRGAEWMAPFALALCVGRVLIANEKGNVGGGKGGDEVREMKGFIDSLAEMSLARRCEGVGSKPDHELWQTAHKHLIAALRTPIEEGKLKRLVRKPLERELVPELFNYEAFLRGLGRMSLNLESHGGLYVLHSHLNHSCEPNISIRHIDQRNALSRITAVAKRRIEVGEELCITYVNPEMGVRARREALKEWNWGLCECARCVKEARETAAAEKARAKELKERGGGTEGGEETAVPVPVNGEEGTGKEIDTAELERELKETLGF